MKRASTFLTISAVLLPMGLCLIVSRAVWNEAPLADKSFWFYEGGLGVLLTLSSLVIAGVGGLKLEPVHPSSTGGSTQLYNRYLVGIGYALFVSGVFCCALVAGMVFSERVDPSGGLFQLIVLDKQQGLATLIVLSSVIAVLGALFFVANSLRQKRDAREPFSAQKFWGGLWYRLGEAILFSLVAFWLIWYNTNTASVEPPEKPSESFFGYSLLPLLSLLMGMFVTSGEKLVFGIASGLFRAAGAFFAPSSGAELPASSDAHIPIAEEPAPDNG